MDLLLTHKKQEKRMRKSMLMDQLLESVEVWTWSGTFTVALEAVFVPSREKSQDSSGVWL